LEPQVPLETATYVSDLVTSNPAASDPLANADDHLRLIKATLKASLAHTGQLTNTDNQLIPAAGTSTKPAYAFAAEPTLGFFRSAAGLIALAGGRLIGASEPGQLGLFVAPPVSLGTATAHTGREWLELNGATYNQSDYPALALRFGVSSGTFTLPDMYTTGRFPRSRTAAIAVLSAQSNTVGPHTHPDVTPTTAAETQEHTHTFSGTTGVDSPDHTHQVSIGAGAASGGVTGGGSFSLPVSPSTVTSGGASTRHTHSFSGTTSGRSATHNHTVTVSTPANTGTTETRPEAMAFVFAVKT
jgi:hypothetical protein